LFSGVQDSKDMTEAQRDSQKAVIEENSLDWGVGFASNLEIDRLGILPATRLAINRAIEQLNQEPEYLLVDYLVLPENPLPQTRLVKGDARSLSIAAASILAKTHRDKLMVQAADNYPSYGFQNNKGYGTAAHRRMIEEQGPCPLHRFSFAPLKDFN
jgi:ribonuclease HII